jgi:PAS domain S-box-containing protein
MRMRALSWWVSAVWVVAFTLLIVNVIVALVNVSSLRQTDALLAQARRSKTETALLAADVADAETATRGFVITGREDFLEPYRKAERTIEGRLARLRELGDESGQPSPRLAELEVRVREKFAIMRRMIDTRRGPEGAARARLLVEAGLGQQAMERVRGELTSVEQHVDRVLAERVEAADERYRSTGYATLLGGGLTLGMAAMAIALARRELAGRKRAEADARKSAVELSRSQREATDSLTLLDTFLAHAPIGMAFFDPQLKYLRINEHLAAANGRPVADHLGRRVDDIAPDAAPDVEADLTTVARTGQPIVNREILNRPGSAERVWLSTYFPVRSPDGRSLGVGVVSRDVTEQRTAEARLRQSEEQFRSLADSIPQLAWMTRADGYIVWYNRRWFEYTGTTPEQMEGWGWQSVHDPGELPRVLAGYKSAMASGQPWEDTFPLRRYDGQMRWHLSRAVPVRDDRGNVLRWFGTNTDISEHRDLEAALRQSLDRFRTLVEAVPQMVCVTNPSGQVTQVNGRWSEFTGLAVGQTPDWLVTVHPDDVNAARQAWSDALAGLPDQFTHECRVRNADGDHCWMLVTAVPLRGERGLVAQWVATFTDIDDQKRQSQILAALVKLRTAELESANHLLREQIAERSRAEGRAQAAAVELGRSNQDLEKFAYVASHDLQEPLRKIQAFGDRLVRKYRDMLTDDGREYVDRMQAAATRMRTLIDDLLSFSRVTTTGQPFSAVDLSMIAAEVVSDLETRITQTGGRIDLGPLPMIDADPVQMRQLFQNLIGNALKFHRPDVAPVVTVRSTPWVGLAESAIPPAPVGVGYRITVADNGIGFAPEYADRVFEVFQRLHGRGDYEGTGIGLAICRKIAQRHGGEILAHGRPGEGAEFVIDLPAHAD